MLTPTLFARHENCESHSALLVVVPIALFVVFAKLFRAAAQSETIHRELHKNAVVSLGGAFFAKQSIPMVCIGFTSVRY